MSIDILDEEASFNELKNGIEAIKIKRIVDNSSFNKNFKNEIMDLLLNNNLGPYPLDIFSYQEIIKNTILGIEEESLDIKVFENILISNINNHYNNFKCSIDRITHLDRSHGTYHYYKYIKRSKRRHGDFDSENSQRLWECKKFKKNPNDVNFYKDVLMKAISYIANDKMEDDVETIAIFRVPPSKPWKDSVMDLFIELIEKDCDNGSLEFDYGCTKKIVNCADFLSRITEVPTFSEEGHGIISEREYLDSMSCKHQNIFDSNTVFLLLDDIVTTGFSMNACYRKLKQKYRDKTIFKLAIAGSVRWYI